MADMDTDTTKRCSKCGSEKPMLEFCRDKHRRDGRTSWCRGCMCASNKKWRAANKEHRVAYSAEYRKANRELYRAAAVRDRAKNRARHRASCAAWQEANPERVKVLNARWRKAHPETIKANWEKWLAANPDRAAAALVVWKAENRERLKGVRAAWATANPDSTRSYAATRRAFKLAGGKHTAADIKGLFKLQRGKCAHPWCLKSLKGGYHVDHVKPLSRGGSNDRANLQLLCQPCNNKKWAHDAIDFAQSNGFLL